MWQHPIRNCQLLLACKEHWVCCDFYVSKARKHMFFRAWKARWLNDKFVYRERHSWKAFLSCKGNTRIDLLVLIALTLFAGVSLFPMLEMECVSSFKTLSTQLTKSHVSPVCDFPFSWLVLAVEYYVMGKLCCCLLLLFFAALETCLWVFHEAKGITKYFQRKAPLVHCYVQDV